MPNYDVMLSKTYRQIKNRVKEIDDEWDRRFGEKEEEFEEDDY